MAMYAWDRLTNCLCPTSKFVFGRWFISAEQNTWQQVKVGLGTDVSRDVVQLQTLNRKPTKVQQLQGDKLSAFESLYHATLGGAKR